MVSDLTGIVTSIVAGSNVTISGSTGRVTINASGGGGGTGGKFNDDQTNSGIHTTSSNVGLGTTNPRYQLEVGSVGAGGTQLWVNGDARITGILSVGTATITLDPTSNKVQIGTGITIDATTNTIEVAGSKIADNSGNAEFTGIVTATTVQVGSATTIHSSGIDLGNGNITSHNINSTGIITSAQLNVTGHTETDTFRVSGISTFSGDVNFDNATLYVDSTNNRIGVGLNNPAVPLHMFGSYPTLKIQNSNTNQYASASIDLQGPAGDERYTKILHGNSNAGGTETYFQIEQYDSSGSYVKKIAQYSYQYDYWDFLPAGTRRLRVDTSGIDVTGHTELDDVNVSGVVTATSIDSATLNSVANLNVASNALTIGTSADTVTIAGNLVVSGTETIIDVERLEVGDNNIGIASTTPKLNDSNLDGAGITIYGSEGDKTLKWSNSNSRMEFNTALSASSFATSGAVTAGSLTVSGNVSIADKIVHTGDTNTAIRFPADDTISADTGGAERIRITSDGKIGIGIQSPAYDLDLGESASTIRLVSEDGGTAIRMGAGGSGNDITLIRVDGGGGSFHGESDSAKFGFSLKYLGSGSGNANALSIFSDNQSGTQVEAVTVFQDGIVGINSTIPSERLDVGGTTQTSQLNVTGVSTFANTISIAETIEHTGDTNTSISFPSTDYIRLTTSGSSRLNVTPNGYILLGTNSEPSGGDAHSRNARLLIHGRVGNAADSGRINLQRGSSASNGSSIGSLTFTDNGNNAYARIETLADAAPGTDDYPGRIVFSTTPDGSASPTERLRIDSNGDVGIGIADPQERLHVARIVMVTGNTPQIRLNANDSDASDDDRTMLGQATANGNFVTTAVDNDTVLRGTSTGNLLFGVGTAEKFRITSAGKFGFGTNDPQGTVHISSGTSGDATLILEADTDNNNEADNPYIVFKQDGGISASAIGHGVDSGINGNILTIANSITDGAITFATGATNGYTNATERLRITRNGRVGIGTDTPEYDLDLGKSASTIRLVSEDGGTAIRIGPGGDSNDITLIRVDGASNAHDGESNSAKLGFSLKYMGSRSQNANSLSLFSDNQQAGTQIEAVTVFQDGTVGINSTIPSERLDVAGTTQTEVN